MTLLRNWAHRLPGPVTHALAHAGGSGGRYCIAAFHRIADIAGDELSYPVSAFADLCRYWRDYYEILPLHTLLVRLARGEAARQPALTITFDDGYADNCETAAPILERCDLSATFFVTTDYIGSGHRFAWDDWLPQTPRLMTWNQVRELRAAGFGIGAHTATHVRLTSVRGAAIERELHKSKQRLERETGAPIADFAYPFGGPHDCDTQARQAVRAAAYRCCLSCHGGLVRPGDSPFALNRISISPRYHPRWRDWARTYARLRWERRADVLKAA